MSDIKHTPLPWQIASDYEPTMVIGDVDCATDAKKHYTEICNVDDPYGEANDRANAEFIVTACNSYYALLQQRQQDEEIIAELVEALKLLQPVIQKLSVLDEQQKRKFGSGDYAGTVENYLWAKELRQIEAAINKATKRVNAVKREEGK